MNIELYVADYIRCFRPAAEREIAFYAEQPDLSAVIEVAAKSEDPRGKRHSHQRRIPGAVLNEASRQLLKHKDILASAQDFDDLHARVEGLIRPIRGIGDLAIYDIARRIASFLHLEPEHVYLHAGTCQGAKAIGLHGKRIAREQLPIGFEDLTAAEIEDLLCIYKDTLTRGTAPPAGCGERDNSSSCRPKATEQHRRC